jgi:hypothetical protein
MPLQRKRVIDKASPKEAHYLEMEMEMKMEMEMEMKMKMKLICTVSLDLFMIYMQYAPVDTINRDNFERTKQAKEATQRRSRRQSAEEATQRRTRRQGAGWVRRPRLRPLLLASTTKSAHTGAGATPRNWLPAGTDGPSTEQR